MSVKHRILQQALVLRLHFREMHVVYQCLAAGINAYSVLFMYGGKGRGSKGRRRRRKEEEDEDGKTRPDIFLYSLYYSYTLLVAQIQYCTKHKISARFAVLDEAPTLLNK